MKHKKTQLAMPFHWIFIIIAGALILLFFVSIIYKQKAVAEEKLSITLISAVEEILAGSGVGEEETQNVIDIPKTELSFICNDETGYSEYSIKDTGIHRETPIDIIFSPDIVKGKQLVIWSLPWSMPFKIDNFLMVSSPAVRYVLVYDNVEDAKVADDIKFDMPEQLTVNVKHISDISTLKDEGHYKIKFVFIGIEPDPIQKISMPSFIGYMPKKDVSAITIVTDPVPFIQFYEKQGNNLIKLYGGTDIPKGRPLYTPSISERKDTMLYAAIFAENAEQYRCNLKKAFKRLILVSEIYENRTRILMGEFSECSAYGIEGFTSLKREAQNCITNLDFCSAGIILNSITNQDNNGIKDRNIAVESACNTPLIY